MNGPTSSFMHSPRSPCQSNQGAGTQGPLDGPPVDKSTLAVRADSAAHSSLVAHSSDTVPPVSSERDNLAP